MTVDKAYPHIVLMWLDAGQPSQLSHRSVQLWTAINEELSPLVGTSGFMALFSRCRDICGASFPWLQDAPAGHSPAMCLDLLGTQLATRPRAEALAASRALFVSFHALLMLLIGTQLTDGVLDAVWRGRSRPHRIRHALHDGPLKPQ